MLFSAAAPGLPLRASPCRASKTLLERSACGWTVLGMLLWTVSTSGSWLTIAQQKYGRKYDTRKQGHRQHIRCTSHREPIGEGRKKESSHSTSCASVVHVLGWRLWRAANDGNRIGHSGSRAGSPLWHFLCREVCMQKGSVASHWPRGGVGEMEVCDGPLAIHSGLHTRLTSASSADSLGKRAATACAAAGHTARMRRRREDGLGGALCVRTQSTMCRVQSAEHAQAGGQGGPARAVCWTRLGGRRGARESAAPAPSAEGSQHRWRRRGAAVLRPGITNSVLQTAHCPLASVFSRTTNAQRRLVPRG